MVDMGLGNMMTKSVLLILFGVKRVVDEMRDHEIT